MFQGHISSEGLIEEIHLNVGGLKADVRSEWKLKRVSLPRNHELLTHGRVRVVDPEREVPFHLHVRPKVDFDASVDLSRKSGIRDHQRSRTIREGYDILKRAHIFSPGSQGKLNFGRTDREKARSSRSISR